MKLAKVTEFAVPSLTRQLFNKAKEYDNVIDLTLGDPDFLTAPDASDAGCEAIHRGRTKYTVNAGIPELRKAISDRIYKDYGVQYDHFSEVIVTVGAMGALYLTMKCTVDAGDEVIIPSPYWINYAQQVQMCGGTPIIVDSYEEDNFNIKIDAIEKAITDKTKIIVINSPNNPTGHVLSYDVMKGIADLAIRHDLIVIADEAYKELIYDGCKYVSLLNFAGMKERTVLINSFSKAYSMTGWRIGYAAAPSELIGKMTAFQENIFACAPTPSQYAALEALTSSNAYTECMVKEFEKRRNVLVNGINRIDKFSCRIPEGAFYAFVNISKCNMDCVDFAYDLLEKQQVAVVPGVTYGDIGCDYVRMAYTVDINKIDEAVSRLEKYAASLD